MVIKIKYITKDNGKKQKFSSGFIRDVANNKPRFDLLIPKDVPYTEQLLTRFAELMQRGAIKYSERNWEKACSSEEAERCKESAFRHFIQWMCNEEDEDHATSILFNIMAYETIKYKIMEKK